MTAFTPANIARCVLSDDDPPFGDGGSDDPVLVELPSGNPVSSPRAGYLGMRNEMQQTLFGDGSSFSMGYSLSAFPSSAGVYSASNDVLMFTLLVTKVTLMPEVAAEVAASSQSLSQGFTNYQIAQIEADAIGSTGQTYPILAIAIAYDQSDGSRVVRVVPHSKRLTYPNMEILFKYATSTPGSIVAGVPDSARTLDDNPNCTGLATDQERCICLAQAAYDACRGGVDYVYNDCFRRACRDFALAIIACTAGVLTSGVFSLLAFMGCIYLLVQFATAIDDCYQDMFTAMSECYKAFRLALQACGIVIYELR